MAKTITRAAFAALCVLGLAGTSRAQHTPPDSTKCDSIVLASRVDTVTVGLFVASARVDGSAISAEQSMAISTAVATTFIIPRPLRLSIFSGPVRMRTFRRVVADTATERREPTVTGVYRFWAKRAGAPSKPYTVRASLIQGFDSAAVEAVLAAQTMRVVMVPPAGEDSMLMEVSIASDSTRNARRVIEAIFPRMPVVDAVPLRDNPAPVFPESEKLDTSSRGEVVFRFVVDRTGTPAMETVEIIRGTSLAFVRAALGVLPQQRFQPATIRGCKISQVVSYPFSFVLPDSGKTPPRH